MTHFFRKAEALLLKLCHHRNRLSVLAQKRLRKVRQRDDRNFLGSVKGIWAEITGEWFLSLIFILAFISIPQILVILRICKFPGAYLFQPLVENNFNNFSVSGVMHSTWQVLGGLIGITFTIVIFLIEFAHSNGYRERTFSVFAEKSNIVFLVIFALLSLLSIGVNVFLIDNPLFDQTVIASITEWNIFLSILNIFAILCLYLKTFNLVQPEFWQNTVLGNLKRNVSQSVEKELVRRISTHILKEYCEKCDIRLILSRYHPVDTNLLSVPIDIAPRHLSRIKDINLSLISMANTRSKKLSSGQGVQLVARPRGTLSPSHSTVAFIPSAANSSSVVELLRNAVVVSGWKESRHSSVFDEVGLGRDLLKGAIESGQSSFVEIIFRCYNEALRLFLETLAKYGFRYTPELAEKENILSGKWSVVSEIRKQFADLIEPALKSGDKEIVIEFMRFLYDVMRTAYQYRDFLLFNRFIGFFVSIYSVSSCSLSLNKSIKDLVYDRCWRTPKEFYLYTLCPDFKCGDFDEDDVRRLGEYVEELVLFFNNLIKRALDFRDEDRFVSFTSAVRTIPSKGFSQELCRLGFERDSVRYKEIERILQARHILFFGLGGYLAHLFETKQITEMELEVYLKPVYKELEELQVLYETYAQKRASDPGRKYNWASWEMDERSETYGEVECRFLTNREWTKTFFVYLALKIGISSGLEISANEQSNYIAEAFVNIVNSEELHPILQYLKKEVGEEEFKKRVESVGAILDRVAEEQRFLEGNQLIAQPLDAHIVENFRTEVLKSWEKWGAIRNLAQFLSSYVPRANAEPPEELRARGINQLEPKGAFVAQSRVVYLNWAENHGQSMAREEDAYLVKKLALALERRRSIIESLDIDLVSAIRDLWERGGVPVVFFSGFQIYKSLHKSSKLIPDWRPQESLPDIAGLIGLYDNAFVVQIGGLEEDTVMVVDIKQFGQLVQYKPENSDQFPLSISVQEINEDRASELLGSQPEFYIDPNTNERIDEEAARRRLLQKVIVTILERIRFEQTDPSAGILIEFQMPEKLGSP